MARSPTAVAASANGEKVKRSSRPAGPRTLWIVLKPGTDPQAVRDMIDTVTFNGREVLRGMGTGATPAVVKYQISGEKQQSEGQGEVESNAGSSSLGEAGSVLAN